MTACERIFGVFDWATNVKEAETPFIFKNFQNQIEFKNVSFAYPDSPQRVILDHVNFKIALGQVVALVGPSGAGKSSVVSLLPRIFDVTQGAIEIDGTDIREVLA